MKFRITLLFFFFLFKNTISAQVMEQDSLALVTFYHATNGPSWIDDTNWLSGEPVSQWFGIQVDGGRVTTIGLSYNNLSGELPPELGNLTGLISLHPYGNQLSGPLPTESGNLVKLEYLDLSSNQLSGSLPASMTGCQNLKSINLSGNNFSGSFPDVLLSFESMEQLDLGNNNFSGPIPPQIGSMIKLQQIGIANNNFSGVMPSLKGLSNLSALYLSSNQLTGDVADFLGYHPDMWYLRLNNNAFTGCVSDTFFNSQKLRFLDIQENQITCLGDFTEFAQGGALDRVSAQDNAIPFEDLETCIGVFQFNFSPQKPLLDSAMHVLAQGDSFSIKSGSAGIYTQYQWFHNGFPITGATSPELVISDFSSDDQGSYFSQMTNEMLPGLTLVRNPVLLQLEGISSVSPISHERLVISPNPVADFLHIHSVDGKILVSIVDTKGQVVLERQVMDHQPIDVSSLVDGIYFVVAQTANQCFTGRFIKNAL